MVNGDLGGTSLQTSILQKALEVDAGVHNYLFSGANYTGNDLPNTDYQYGSASIFKRSNSSIRVILYGSGTEPIAYNDYTTSWSGWRICITNSDLTPVAMTLTRTENPYVSATSFNRIAAKRIGPNLLWVLFNVWIDLTPLPNSDDIVEIGKVNGISGVPFGTLFDIPAQNGSGTILLDFRDNGVFKIVNQSGSSVSGFVRTSFVAVVDFS